MLVILVWTCGLNISAYAWIESFAYNNTSFIGLSIYVHTIILYSNLLYYAFKKS